MLAERAQFVGPARHRGVHVGASGNVMQRAAEQAVQQHVAGDPIVRLRVAGAVLEQDLARQPEPGRGRGGLPGVIGLRGALRDDDVGLLRQRLAHQVLELARLVAAGREPRAVVALDPQLRPAERPRQVGHRLQRGRRVRQSDARKACQFHRAPSTAVDAAAGGLISNTCRR